MKFLAIIAICVILGMSVAFGGSQGGKTFEGCSIFLIVAALAFAINWLAFIPAYLAKTERFYDLTGSITYLSTIGLAAYLSAPLSLTAKIVAVAVCIWAARLGTFLFARISRDGGDSRFDKIKTNPLRFLLTWTLQGLWVVLTASCAFAIITSTQDVGLGPWFYAGMALWLVGFLIEVVADGQKSAFKKDPENAGKFIHSGLWAWSRHPNYFGEILLWLGIAVIAVPHLAGWQWVCLVSPLFVYLLLTRVSGVPLLEKKAYKKWGDDPAYQAYLKNTPVLFLRPPRKG